MTAKFEHFFPEKPVGVRRGSLKVLIVDNALSFQVVNASSGAFAKFFKPRGSAAPAVVAKKNLKNEPRRTRTVGLGLGRRQGCDQ